ncbi:hypothetical protein SAMN05445850_5591 [Paraburkholderia tuberum]|uniref:Uncharacterized protein n=1 Tax=Paraburkholderia tuberum TaxID=157910 RepID=A0A1H1JT12_9BURK|nr:hypothetical protein SAMN05445850_5591 [Paraburkholderia tuberum]
MLKRRLMLCAPTCALAMSGCALQPPVASLQPVAVACPMLAPPAAELMEPEQPNLTDRLLTRFSASPGTVIGQSEN